MRNIFSKGSIFLLKKNILRRVYSIELKFSGLVVLSRFGVVSIELFGPVHFVEVIH